METLFAVLIYIAGCSGDLRSLRLKGARFVFSVWPLHVRLLHIPGRGWAALGAESAMDTQVFVLDHDPTGLREACGNHQGLCQVFGGSLEPRTQIGLLAVLSDGEAIHRADVDTGVALDTQLCAEHRLHIAVQ